MVSVTKAEFAELMTSAMVQAVGWLIEEPNIELTKDEFLMLVTLSVNTLAVLK